MKTLHLTLSLIFVMFITSCECLHRERVRVGFTQVQKQFFPPYKKDTIYSFIDDHGQTIDFHATKEKWWTQEVLEEGVMCSDYVSFEDEHIGLKSDSDEIHLWLRVNRSETNENGNFDGILRWDGSCKIQISTYIIFPHWKSYLSSEINIDKEGVILPNTYTFLHESMEIDGHIYQNVIETRETVKDTTDTSQIPTQIFYNKDYGLIQIIVDGRNYLMLKH